MRVLFAKKTFCKNFDALLHNILSGNARRLCQMMPKEAQAVIKDNFLSMEGVTMKNDKM